jgi:hypothetical protein
VPWCTDCDRYLSPSTVRADGTCPTCGRPVDAAASAAEGRAEGAVEGAAKQTKTEELPPIPWHLKLLALAVAVYLGWRLIQGIQWVLG